jgi:hypothetical protein
VGIPGGISGGFGALDIIILFVSLDEKMRMSGCSVSL